MNTGTVKLIQDVGKVSGKPYTALKISVGKWNTFHFPTPFEKDYLIDYFADGKEAQLSINENGTLRISAGDYVHDYKIESTFEEKYVTQYFRSVTQTPATDSKHDSIDLSQEDELNENPFGN